MRVLAIVLLAAVSSFAQNGRSSDVILRVRNAGLGEQRIGNDVPNDTPPSHGMGSVLSFATLERLLGDPSLEGLGLYRALNKCMDVAFGIISPRPQAPRGDVSFGRVVANLVRRTRPLPGCSRATPDLYREVPGGIQPGRRSELNAGHFG